MKTSSKIILAVAFAVYLLFEFCAGLYVGNKQGHQEGYRSGQLDYAQGKIEWTFVDGKVHHIEEDK